MISNFIDFHANRHAPFCSCRYAPLQKHDPAYPEFPGKTFLAQSYLEAYGGQYFSFRNLDAVFAPQIFWPGCKLWREFFAEIGETKNRPVIFFDDVDDRNDKEEFLNALPELAGKAYVVLIVRNQMELPFPSDILQMTAVTVPMLLAENKALDPLDALRTIAITDGIPELVRLFDFQRTFAENLGLLFTQNSVYFPYAESELHRNFRTPETYSILLYGMATGHNRISQLAEFSCISTQITGDIKIVLILLPDILLTSYCIFDYTELGTYRSISHEKGGQICRESIGNCIKRIHFIAIL